MSCKQKENNTKKLYVIGNGFDLAHSLPTAYSDFHDWLRGVHYQLENKKDYSNFVAQMDEIFSYVNNRKIEWWCDFENALGDLQIGEYIKHVTNEFKIEDPEDEHYKNLGALAEQVFAHIDYIAKPWALDEVKKKFAEWVRSILLYDDLEPTFSDEDIDQNALFLTFNYTCTLEKIYNINPKQVLHIHGCVSEHDSDIIVGHITKYDTSTYAQVEEELFGVDDDIFPSMVNVMNDLGKPIRKIIKQHKTWFELLGKRNIEEIYLYGLSFGEIDDDYYKEIYKVLPNAKWCFAIHANGIHTQQNVIMRINKFRNRIGIPKENCRAFNQDYPKTNIIL